MENIDKNQFKWVGPNKKAREGMARKSVTYWQDAMRRLFSNKVAVLCLIIVVFIGALTIFVPVFSPFESREQHLTHANAPMFTVCTQAGLEGHLHLFGTDTLGRDIFVRTWEGGQVSLFIAFTAVFINFLIGIVYGGVSGYFGGALDTVLMRTIEIINGIPYLIIVILLKMIIPADTGVMSLVIAYAAVGWTGMARLVRGQVIGLKEQEFVVAAQAMGAKAPRIILRHLLPNTLSVVIVNITLAIPSAIFTEAFLSFIGMGVPVPYCSWGTLASEGVKVFQLYPSQLIIPAVCISLIMLSFNLLGDGLRDAFDPRLRR